MGRKTFDSIGKPLKLRRNIVLTRDRSYDAPGIETVTNIEEVFELTRDAGEIAVIGGSEIFAEFAPVVDSIYATEIDADVEGDVRFALPDRAYDAVEIGRQEPDERHAYAMRFVRYDFTKHPDRNNGGSANESNPSS